MRQVEERLGQSLRLYLVDQYMVQGRSMAAIGRDIGVDKGTLSRWFTQLGIPPRYVGYNGRGKSA
jgi:transposase-like protein